MNTYQACQILKVSSNAEYNDIKYAYRKLALELHPDKNGMERDGSKFKNVTEAYHLLKNSHKKVTAMKRPKSNNHDYSYQKSRTEQKQTREKQWTEDAKSKTPEEDWGRFTKDAESDHDFWKQYEKDFWQKYHSKIKESSFQNEYAKSSSTKPQVDWEVGVDESLCIACCSCETIAPGVFIVDKFTKMNPKSRVYNKIGSSQEKIMDAAQTCPTKAIWVDESEAKKRIYPW
jgi:DnaJ-class molecular chaperone